MFTFPGDGPILPLLAATAGEATVVWLAVAAFASLFVFHRRFAYVELSTAERGAVDAALDLLERHGQGGYATVARRGGQKILAGRIKHWGYTPPTFRTIVLRVDAIGMDPPLLAALLLHELVHSTQKVWPLRGVGPWERHAYSVQSAFMKSVGISGDWQDALAAVPKLPTHRAYLLDQAESFARYGVPNPAVKPPRRD